MYILHTFSDRFAIDIEHSSVAILIDRQSGNITKTSAVGNTVDTAFSQRIHGIIGVITLLRGKYLLAITDSKSVGTLQGNEIRQLTDATIIPYNPDQQLTAQQSKDEEQYLALLRRVLLTGRFYFSYDYDLTLSSQNIAELATGHSQNHGDSNHQQQQQSGDDHSISLSEQGSYTPGHYKRADTRYFWLVKHSSLLPSDLIRLLYHHGNIKHNYNELRANAAQALEDIDLKVPDFLEPFDVAEFGDLFDAYYEHYEKTYKDGSDIMVTIVAHCLINQHLGKCHYAKCTRGPFNPDDIRSAAILNCVFEWHHVRDPVDYKNGKHASQAVQKRLIGVLISKGTRMLPELMTELAKVATYHSFVDPDVEGMLFCHDLDDQVPDEQGIMKSSKGRKRKTFHSADPAKDHSPGPHHPEHPQRRSNAERAADDLIHTAAEHVQKYNNHRNWLRTSASDLTRTKRRIYYRALNNGRRRRT